MYWLIIAGIWVYICYYHKDCKTKESPVDTEKIKDANMVVLQGIYYERGSKGEINTPGITTFSPIGDYSTSVSSPNNYDVLNNSQINSKK
jgi:hypothetical protein